MSEHTSTVALPVRHAGFIRLTGLAGVLGGFLLIVVAVVVWITVSSQLRAENIVIPDDAIAFQGKVVDGPLDALIQANIISTHALEASGGKTYAELDQDDPLRTTVMNASFLRTSLFTSVVSFGVAAFAAGVGVLMVLFGLSLRWLVPSRKAAAAAA